MPLTQEDIDALKRIYKEEFGRTLCDDEAWAMGHRLLGLYRLLYRRDSRHQPDVPRTTA